MFTKFVKLFFAAIFKNKKIESKMLVFGFIGV